MRISKPFGQYWDSNSSEGCADFRKVFDQGRPIKIWLGGLAPEFSNYWGGGKIALEFPIIGEGGENSKIPTYLYKGICWLTSIF